MENNLRKMLDIKDFSLEELRVWLKNCGEQEFHASQIFSWIYKKQVQAFDQMSDLSQELRKKLKESFFIFGSTLKKQEISGDGTEKFLFSLKDVVKDVKFVETVVIPAEDRATVCLSCQAGCRFGCKFCASGLLGFSRNLSCGEIIEQALFIKNYLAKKALTHVVMMGTGEPLDNYDNVIKAVKIINSKEGINIGARRITISTCGLVPGIKRLAEEKMQFELSVSLHAGTDAVRSRIMPVNKIYPLKELVFACKEYICKTGRQITFEYVMIKNLNSSLQEAEGLVRMVKQLGLVKINLIPVNPVPEYRIEPPNKLEAILFKDALIKAGVNVTLRKARGQDILAACGQLRLRYEK